MQSCTKMDWSTRTAGIQIYHCSIKKMAPRMYLHLIIFVGKKTRGVIYCSTKGFVER